jgi:glycosyltransferase involved in cell wall biosynthesis
MKSPLLDGLITVVIPAYNAAQTLDETLRSVRGQTYRNLEIIVVDDGSKDATAEVAQAHALQDDRIRLICQPNQGVSAARNAGLALARGSLLATIDSDDLWHPEKLELQQSAMSSDPDSVLNYTWYAYIDEKGLVISTAEPEESGQVLARMCRGNLLGTGSTPLMRTQVLLEIGGWDADIRGGQEDFLNYFLMAEKGSFSVLRQHLVGYRQARGNASSGSRKMLVNYDRILTRIKPRHPQYHNDFEEGRLELIAYLFDKALLNLQLQSTIYLTHQYKQQAGAKRGTKLLMGAPLVVARMLLPLPARAAIRRMLGKPSQRATPFLPSLSAA